MNYETQRMKRSDGKPRRGVITILAAIMLVVMVGMIAFAVDVGYMYTVQAELQRSVDAAALAGASELVNGSTDAQAKAVEYLVRNPVGGATTFDNQTGDINTATSQFLSQFGNQLTIQSGDWNVNTKQVVANTSSPSAISVSRTYGSVPLFFAPIFGTNSFSVTAKSTATCQMRDIMLVLDFSGSMNDDSQFYAYSTLGKTEVDANLLQCYQDLGSPRYGSLPYEPVFANVPGAAPTDSTKPQIYVEYRNTSVYVTSTKNLENVVLQYSNNAKQTFSGLTSMTGTFAGTGSNAGKSITKLWVKSGNNLSGQGTNYGEPFDFSSTNMATMVKKAFGLQSVAYPYSQGGSWDNYISWCNSSSGQNNNPGGYRYKFGFKSLFVYWLENYPAYAQVPDLWKASAQPVTSLKDSVDVFVNMLNTIPIGDQLGLSIYDYTDGNAILEQSLSTNYSQVGSIVRQRQAGHYHSYTNIGAGLQKARLHLDAAGRKSASKVIILMTDGNANWVNGGYNVAAANQFVIDEANLCADPTRKYPIYAISFGAGADTAIMDQIAQITSGIHFNVPGGRPIADIQADLSQVFENIAKYHPLKIVQ